jgi:TRAP-type C4-dicarboxylate transport system permease small subunit
MMIWTQIAVGFTVLVCFTFLCYYCCRNRHMRTRFQTSVRQVSAIPEPQLLLLVSLFLLFLSFSVSLFRRLFFRFQNVSKSIRSLVLLSCRLQTA